MQCREKCYDLNKKNIAVSINEVHVEDWNHNLQNTVKGYSLCHLCANGVAFSRIVFDK